MKRRKPIARYPLERIAEFHPQRYHMTRRINITVSGETEAQAKALLRDQITPNFSGLVRKLVAEAHAKAFSVKPLRRRKNSPK